MYVLQVGIIMYMPTDRDQDNAAVTSAFEDYRHLVDRIGPKVNAASHWAKLEVGVKIRGKSFAFSFCRLIEFINVTKKFNHTITLVSIGNANHSDSSRFK